MRTAQQAKKTTLKTGLNPRKEAREMMKHCCHVGSQIGFKHTSNWNGDESRGWPPRRMDHRSRSVESGAHSVWTWSLRRAGRPANRWEDDLNDFVKDEDTEATQSNDLNHKNTWLIIANIYEWEKKKENMANPLSTIEESQITSHNTTSRRWPSALEFIADSSSTATKTQCSSSILSSSSLPSSVTDVWEF